MWFFLLGKGTQRENPVYAEGALFFSQGTEGSQTQELGILETHGTHFQGDDEAVGLLVGGIEVEDFQRLSLFHGFLEVLELCLQREGFCGQTIPILGEEMHHFLVHEDVLSADGLLEDDAFESTAPRQGHIHLAVGKSSPTDVDYHPVKGQSLTLVNGDGPGKSEGKLGEGANA